jgi:MFS family permease
MTAAALPGDASMKRDVAILAVAQALGGATPSVVIALGGLVGYELAADKSLATLPVSVMQLGLALFTLPMGWLAQRAGRKAAALCGAGVGIVGGVIAAVAIVQGSLAGFCLATLVLGCYFATVQQYRFAAADMAEPAFKARAISWVMLGGIAGGVIGPQTAILTKDLLLPTPFAGAFIGQIGLAVVAVLVIATLRSIEPRADPMAPSGPARPLAEILAQPRLIAAIVCGLVSYGLMSFVMTAAPLAMVGCGHAVTLAWWGIQWHVLAMYLPSFFTGRLIDRFGKEAVTAAGIVLLILSAVIALSGLEVLHFWSSLILLGVGWNFGFVGATALVIECYRASERGLVQSVNDFAVFGTVAAASFASGHLLNAGGWNIVNWLVFPGALAALAALVVSHWLRPAPA